MISEIFANGLVFLWLYWLIVILDESNRLTSLKLLIFVTMLTATYIALEYHEIQISFIATIMMAVSVFSTLNSGFKVSYLVDIMIGQIVQIFITISVSVSIFPVLGNILDSMSLMILFLIVLNLIFCCLVECKILPQKWLRMYRDNRNTIGLYCVIVIVIANIVLHYWNYNNDDFWQYKNILIPFFILTYILSLLILFNIMKSYSQKKELSVYEEYGSYLEEMVDQVSQRKHEYHNQINTIIGIIETNSEFEAIASVRHFCETILQGKEKEIKESIINGPGIVAAVINRKIQQAAKDQIKFDHMIAKPFPMFPLSTYQMAELLINLLNNAFEHVQQLPVNEREVSLVITKDKIEVANSIEENFNASFLCKGESSKSYDRGFGLSNMKQIIENAHGELEIVLNTNTNVISMIAIFDDKQDNKS